ncbi:uncharacterized protein LOC143363797 [Halictus rubicundus]|uniref:uncharacterized protein LOC143363797 n=2 Tax=Halictus rubicundus TaxID=77578 RepID=UPI00403500A8
MASQDKAQPSERDLIRKRATIKTKLTLFKEALELSAEDNQFESRLNERAEFEAQYFETLAMARQLEGEHDRAQAQADRLAINAQLSHSQQFSGLGAGNSNADSPLTVHSETHTQVKLPTMQLPEFSGSCDGWPSFSDAFRAAVHDDVKLRGVQKLVYLKSCVKGQAAGLIESLETTEANYSVAWDILEKTYNDPRIIINNRIQAFFELQACTRNVNKSLTDLTHLVTKHYNALKALKKPFLESFPIYAITSKLDDQTRLKWREHTQDTEIPSMDDLLQFLHSRCKILEPARNEPIKATSQSFTNPNIRIRKLSNSNVHALTLSVQKGRCALCKGNHYIQYCQKFLSTTVERRIEIVQKAGLCINCLRPNHDVTKCTFGTCKQCNEKHNTLLHKEPSARLATVVSLKSILGIETFISTAVVYIPDKAGRLISCRVILDSASQSNLMTERFAKRLGLSLKGTNIPIIGVNKGVSNTMHYSRATIQSRINKFTADATFFILPSITATLPSKQISKTQLQIPSNLPLADPNFNVPSEIDVLLGVDLFYEVQCVGKINLANSSLILSKTKFGWVLAGTVPGENSNQATHCHVTRISLNDNISRFWELEEIPQRPVLSIDESTCEKHYVEHITRDSVTGKYTVKLPFKSFPPNLGDSYKAALRRFHALETKLAREPALREEYVNFLREYQKLGHMTKLESANTTEGYYLPHHAIVKTDSLTTKVRVVFDASAKTTSGQSLNDNILTGPTIQEELYALLIKFRTYTYVITADIEKMYRQIEVSSDHRIYQKILWRETPDNPIETYALNTVTYGTSAAPFLAIRTLFQLAADEGENFPRAARVLREDFYVDDMLTGADTFEEAVATINEIQLLCAKGGFKLRKWATNKEGLIHALTDKAESVHLKLDLDTTIKTLGVYWNARTDAISYMVKESALTNKVTKRTILSKIATLFDPLGLLGPVIVRAKLIMQTLWKLQLDWDESLPTDLHTEWVTFWEELHELQNLQIRRHVMQADCTEIQLHGFCDASERAYGACLYLRSSNKHGLIITQLIASKSRVAPLKTVTLPRLELCAAQLLAHLFASTKQALRHVNINKVFFWSDSTVALHWIKSAPHTLKTFISHRVTEIQEITDISDWRHIASAENPADFISRGMRSVDFIHCDLWHRGPSWLALEEEQWPISPLQPIDVPELRPITTLTTQIPEPDFLIRFSSFQRLKRVVAYMLRFVQNSLKKSPSSGPLSTRELNNAELRIVTLVQQQAYKSELREIKASSRISNLSSLTPILDDDGILRVGGRLKNAALPFREKHPILLPKSHLVTRLIIHEAHLKNLHAGVQATLNAIRQYYWIPQDLTTEAFLAALRRFFSRRGRASDIYSDNATNFVGANKEIRELYSFLSDKTNNQAIVESLANQSITWHFIPPRSPHFGGIWEAAVKSLKHHLGRVMGEALLSFEGLLTLTAQIEAVLNSRPLTPISSDPNDLTAITPGHFLIGESLINMPDHDYAQVPDGRLSSWQYIQKIKAHFWKRWKTEYLQELTVRRKWHSGGTFHLPIGSMVILQEDNTPPMKWPLGRVTAIHPGEDGIIRVVTVKTSRGEYKRSVKRLSPLPVDM